MKLLPKSEVSKEQAIQKRQQQDEGLKLAGRVDGLRELQTKEEKNLAQFREKTLAEITKQISEAAAERDGILSEVRRLRSEKQIGMEDVAWAKFDVDNFAASVKKREEAVEEKSIEIVRKEVLLSKSLKKALADEKTAEVRRQEAEKLQSSAFEDAKESKVALMVAKNTQEQAILAEERTKEALSAREAILARNEANLAKKEDQNAKDRAEIERDKVRIKDRYAMLERDKKRL
jgi:hypothetical protein